MKGKLFLRIAAGCLLFFTAGHSVGHFTRHETTDPGARAALEAMISNKFDMFGQVRTYDENYTGMSLFLIFTLITFALILIFCSAHLAVHDRLIKKISLLIGICSLVFSVICFTYFFPMPAIASLLAGIFALLAAFQIKPALK